MFGINSVSENMRSDYKVDCFSCKWVKVKVREDLKSLNFTGYDGEVNDRE